ncbi:MAG: TetR/AcrR family transcriptional regulator, partial [Spirochaetota bacterium]
MKNKKDTREKIIETAVALFNEKGAHSVTTNHIADKMGMSPGNLYYHYRNKQEIIREIFDMIALEFTRIWTKGSSSGDHDRFFEIYMKTAD